MNTRVPSLLHSHVHRVSWEEEAVGCISLPLSERKPDIEGRSMWSTIRTSYCNSYSEYNQRKFMTTKEDGKDDGGDDDDDDDDDVRERKGNTTQLVLLVLSASLSTFTSPSIQYSVEYICLMSKVFSSTLSYMCVCVSVCVGQRDMYLLIIFSSLSLLQPLSHLLPLAMLDNMSKLTQAAPCPSPMMVTFDGSPPKFSIFSAIQCKAADWSIRAKLPREFPSKAGKNPIK